MKLHLLVRLIWASTLAAWGVVSLPAHAQTVSPMPPDTMVMTPGGVDLRSGSLKMDRTLLSMGEGQIGALDFRRITRTYGFREPPGRMNGFNHNWDIRFKRQSRPGAAGADVSVTSDELSFTFFDLGADYSPDLTSAGNHAKLARTTVGSNYYYTLTTADGTVVVSQNIASDGTALATSVTKANGAAYSLTYDSLGPSGSYRLRRVTSNAGYALLFQYAGNGYVSKACILNLAITPAPSDNNCPGGAKSVAYGYSGYTMVSETDASGAVWPFTSTYVDGGTSFTQTFKEPGAATPYLTVDYEYVDNYKLAVSRQTFADGKQFNYTWSVVYPQEGEYGLALVPTHYSENSSATVEFKVWRPNAYVPPKVSPGPAKVTDSLGRTTSFDICMTCVPALVLSKTLPGGMKATYDYDSYGHIVKTTITPNTGSGEPAIVTSATYNCSTMTFCNKPVTEVDAKGATTTSTYSSVHGQILITTGPAVGGVQPQTRYIYAQRSAWIKNGAGGYVATAPIWVLAEESLCKTGAPHSSGTGCAIAGDEVRTTYDYGPNSGPNNLLLRGKVVDAGGLALRTCYGYDADGRKISETTPNANLTSCP